MKMAVCAIPLQRADRARVASLNISIGDSIDCQNVFVVVIRRVMSREVVHGIIHERNDNASRPKGGGVVPINPSRLSVGWLV